MPLSYVHDKQWQHVLEESLRPGYFPIGPNSRVEALGILGSCSQTNVREFYGGLRHSMAFSLSSLGVSIMGMLLFHGFFESQRLD